jgi:hypothetical protein
LSSNFPNSQLTEQTDNISPHQKYKNYFLPG